MFPQRCLCWKLLSEFRSLDAMESTFTGHALVLKNYANPTDQKFWSRLYTPTIEVTETSCLGFYTKLRRYSTFQVRLVWAESQSIYRTEGPKAELMKVDIRLFSANYEVIYIFINLINVYIRISYWRLWLIYALVSPCHCLNWYGCRCYWIFPLVLIKCSSPWSISGFRE